MSGCALINISLGIVENMIVAEQSDPAPEGYLLICDPPPFVTMGTKWDGEKFIDPNAPPQIEGLETL